MYEPLQFVETITATKTNDLDLNNDNPQTYEPADLVAYLNENPRHAVVITDLDEASGECVATTPVYVFRSASDEPDSFYYGPYPAEDPGDAEGGDLDATNAISLALDLLCS